MVSFLFFFDFFCFVVFLSSKSMLRSLASFSVKPNLVGRGLTEKTVQDVMRDLSAVRNKPVPGLVVRSGYSDRTVTVAIQRLVPYHPVYRKNNGKRFAVTKLMVHDPDNSCFAGDRVLIQKSKPYSRRKHHVVRSIIKMEPGREFLEKNPEYNIPRSELKKVKRQRSVKWVNPQ